MGAVVQAVVEPVVKAVEQVGQAVESAGREVGKAVEKVGQEVGNAAEAVGEGVATVAKTIEENPATALAIVAVAIATPYALPAATAALGTTAGTMAVAAAGGAVIGAAQGIDTGGNVLDPALKGAAIAGLTAGLAPGLTTGLSGLGVPAAIAPTLGSTLAGAATGAGMAAINNGDIGTSALSGGVGAGVGTGVGTAVGGGALGSIAAGLSGGAAGALAAGKNSEAALVGAITGGVNAALSVAANELVKEGKPVTPGNLSEKTGVEPQKTASYTDELTMALADALGYEVSLNDVQKLAQPDVNNAFKLAQLQVKIYGVTDIPEEGVFVEKTGKPLNIQDVEQKIGFKAGETYDIDPDTGVVTVFDSNNNPTRTVVLAQQAPAPVVDSRQPSFTYTPSVQDQALLNIIQREQDGGGAAAQSPTYVAPSAPAPEGATTATGSGTGGGGAATEGGMGTGDGTIKGTGIGEKFEITEPVDVEVTAPRPGGIPEIPIPEIDAEEPISKTEDGKTASARGKVSVRVPSVRPTGAITRPGRGSMGFYPTAGSQALAQALNVIPGVAGGGGDVDPSRTGGKKRNVWNVESLKLKDALGA